MKSEIKNSSPSNLKNVKSKKYIILITLIIAEMLLVSGISVYASYNYFANEINYTETKTVSQALDELYKNKKETTDETKEITTNGSQTLDKYYKNLNVNVSNNTSVTKFLTNGQISSANPDTYLTAKFQNNIKTNSIIFYKVRIGNDVYGPYNFLYKEEGQLIGINAHTTISCQIYNDRISATSYPGSWYNIYIDMCWFDLNNLNNVEF